MDNSQYGQQSLDGNLFALISDWNPSNLFEIRDVVFVIYNSPLFFILIMYIYILYIFICTSHIYNLDCHIYIYTCILFHLHSYFYNIQNIYLFFLPKAFITHQSSQEANSSAEDLFELPSRWGFWLNPCDFLWISCSQHWGFLRRPWQHFTGVELPCNEHERQSDANAHQKCSLLLGKVSAQTHSNQMQTA